VPQELRQLPAIILISLAQKLWFLVSQPVHFLHHLVEMIKRNYLPIDRNTKVFISHNEEKWGKWKTPNTKPIILFDYYPVAETEIARSYLLNILAKKFNSRIVSYSSNRIRNRSWDKIYRSFNVCEHVHIRLSNIQNIEAEKTFNNVIKKIDTRKDLFDLEIFGVHLGVEIYEEYLMRYVEPTVYLNDERLHPIIKEAIESLIFWRDFFQECEVKAIVSANIGVRLRGNLPVKVAGQLYGIPFYSTHARGITFYREPHLFQEEVWKKFLNYPERFRKLSEEEQSAGILWAKERIKKRLSGKIGVDMAYSTKSAFKRDQNHSPVTKQNSKLKVLVATHEFYDSPNCYGGLLFIDFYEWLLFLGDVSKKTDYDWYIKTHPDVMEKSKTILQRFVRDFPNFTLVPEETSFHQLANEKIKFVLTCYGSVGHECPLLGMNVINAGNNPHMGYTFNWHPKSTGEYLDLLLNLNSLSKRTDFHDIYEFYFMHYKKEGIIDDWIYPSYKMLVDQYSEKFRFGSEIFPYFVKSLSDEKHLKIIQNMTNYINSGTTGSAYTINHDPGR